MLAGERSAELEHQIGAGRRNRFELPDAGFRLEVDDRTDVETADRCVRVDAGARAVRADHRKKAIDVFAQPLGRHRRVFDEGQRLGIAFHRHRQAEGRFAERPDRGLRRGVGGMHVAIAEVPRSQIALEGVEPRRQVVGAIVVHLDAEKRRRIALDDPLPHAFERRDSASCDRG